MFATEAFLIANRCDYIKAVKKVHNIATVYSCSHREAPTVSHIQFFCTATETSCIYFGNQCSAQI